MIGILIKNEINNIVQILKKLRLKILCEINYENVFFIKIKKSFINDYYKFIIINLIKKVITLIIIIFIILNNNLLTLINYNIAE